jgi:hypothetical chaperone protein
MRAPDNQTYVGIDFGTTNTVICLCDGSGATTTLMYPSSKGPVSTFRSIICYVQEDADNFSSETQVFCGPAAVEAFLLHAEQARLIQSVKTFLSSRAFSTSLIHNREYTLENILTDFLRGLIDAALWPGGDVDMTSGITVGRPVKFAGSGGDEALAESRLRKAFSAVGARHVDLALEPQAAAYYFARRLREPATVLVADLGGGTSDFSIIRFDPATGTAEPLGHAGVGIAGDTLDFRIIDHVVAPAFGKGSKFRPLDKWLDVPKSIYFEFEHWHRLSFLKRPAVLRELRKIELVSDSPEKIAALRIFLEQELGFPLYEAVNRCKSALSVSDEADLNFCFPPIELKCRVRRSDFEKWIEQDVAAIRATCSDALSVAGLTEEDISVVFMTGGTSFVPLIREQFKLRFGPEKIVSGDEFVSVGNGLALLARDRAHHVRPT